MISDPASNDHSALPQVRFGRNSSSSSDSSNWFRSTCSVRLNSERKKQQQNKFQKKQSALIVTASALIVLHIRCTYVANALLDSHVHSTCSSFGSYYAVQATMLFKLL